MRATLLLLLVALLVGAPAADAAFVTLHGSAAGEPLPLVVAGEFTVEDGTRLVTGGVTVLPGGHLTVRNATLRFVASESTHPTVHVLPGARLTVEDATLTNAAAGGYAERAAAWWSFLVEGVATLERCNVAYADAVHFHGAGTRGSRVSACEVRDGARSLVRGSAGASFLLEGNRLHRTHALPGDGAAGGVVLEGTDGVELRGNLVEDVLGEGLVAYFASVSGTLASAAGPVLEHNLLVDSGALRSPDGVGTYAVLAQGGNPGFDVRGNAIAASWVGILTSLETGAWVEGNDVVGVRFVPDAPAPGVGLRASGTFTGFQAYRWTPRFEGNRVDGFRYAAEAPDGSRAVFTGNAFLAGNAHGLYADEPVDARGNYWGHASGPRDANDTDASTPLLHRGDGLPVEGPVDYRLWLGEDQTQRTLRVTAERGSDGRVTATVRHAFPQATAVDVFVRGPLADARAHHAVLEPGAALRFSFHAPAGAPALVLARAPGGAALATA